MLKLRPTICVWRFNEVNNRSDTEKRGCYEVNIPGSSVLWYLPNLSMMYADRVGTKLIPTDRTKVKVISGPQVSSVATPPNTHSLWVELLVHIELQRHDYCLASMAASNGKEQDAFRTGRVLFLSAPKTESLREPGEPSQYAATS